MITTSSLQRLQKFISNLLFLKLGSKQALRNEDLFLINNFINYYLFYAKYFLYASKYNNTTPGSTSFYYKIRGLP